MPRVAAWALEHLAEALDVDGLAARAHLSRRTFDRRFREWTGTSPKQWLLHQRVLRAQQLLEQTDLPVDGVARAAGFSDGVALRPHFRRISGVPPRTHRETFRGAGSSPRSEAAAYAGGSPAAGRLPAAGGCSVGTGASRGSSEP